MSLQARLDQMREAFEKKVPAAARETMHRATDALRASGAAERALGVGESFPEFELPTSTTERISSAALRQSGPLVLTFFRGHW